MARHNRSAFCERLKHHSAQCTYVLTSKPAQATVESSTDVLRQKLNRTEREDAGVVDEHMQAAL